MIVKVITNIVLEVKDVDEAEQACMAIESLDGVMRSAGFPHGEIIVTDVDHYAEVSAQEAEEQGWVE
jgi:hypothetical protein